MKTQEGVEMEAIGLVLMVTGLILAVSQLWILPSIFKEEKVPVQKTRTKRSKQPWRYEPPAEVEEIKIKASKAS